MEDIEFQEQALNQEQSKRTVWKLEISTFLNATWSDVSNWLVFWSVNWFIIASVNLIGLFIAAKTYFGVSGTLSSILIAVAILVMGIIYFLWNAAQKIRGGVENTDQQLLEEGFIQLEKAYRLTVIGILSAGSLMLLLAAGKSIFVLLAD